MNIQEMSQSTMLQRGKIVEGIISNERPDLIELFFTYQNEAIQARKFLESSLMALDPGAEILEVGGGILALTVQLASEGFVVTSVEPIGEGFSDISFIMNIYSKVASQEGLNYTLIDLPIENCIFSRRFDLVFSINVMEHIRDPYAVILQISKVLKRDARFRFVCPNYDFPYEPHFGKWIFSRNEKAFYLREERAKSSNIASCETQGLYRSLNFISFRKIKQHSNANGIKLEANPRAFYNLLERVVGDKKLSARHGILTSIVKLIYKLKLNGLANLVPVAFQPVMDIEVSSQKI